MSTKRLFWTHPTTYTYRLDEPEQRLETLWVERPGWGYLKSRDLWVPRECTIEELIAEGYEELRPATDGEVMTCPFCSMYICGIPGYLVETHFHECGNSGEDQRAMEDEIIQEQRVLMYQRAILDRIRREREALEREERLERFDRIKEENLARQQSKDRKKRLKEETKKQLREK